jgi:hypothetical protein
LSSYQADDPSRATVQKWSAGGRVQWKSDVATLVAAAAVAMRSPCAGDALDPPLWIVPNKSLSLSYFPPYSHFLIVNKTYLSLSLPLRRKTFLRPARSRTTARGRTCRPSARSGCECWSRRSRSTCQHRTTVRWGCAGAPQSALLTTVLWRAVRRSGVQCGGVECSAEEWRAVRRSGEKWH